MHGRPTVKRPHTFIDRSRCRTTGTRSRTSNPAATPARTDSDAAANVVVVQRAHALELDLREKKFCFPGDVVVSIRIHHHLQLHHHQVVRVLVVTGGALVAR